MNFKMAAGAFLAGIAVYAAGKTDLDKKVGDAFVSSKDAVVDVFTCDPDTAYIASETPLKEILEDFPDSTVVNAVTERSWYMSMSEKEDLVRNGLQNLSDQKAAELVESRYAMLPAEVQEEYLDGQMEALPDSVKEIKTSSWMLSGDVDSRSNLTERIIDTIPDSTAARIIDGRMREMGDIYQGFIVGAASERLAVSEPGIWDKLATAYKEVENAVVEWALQD